MRSLRLGHWTRLQLGFATCAVAVACTDIDTTRNTPPRGTIGEEVYGAFCDRLASLVLPEDLTGDSYHGVCHKQNGTFANQVDTSKLPVVPEANAVDSQGNPVPPDKQLAVRNYALARIGAMVRRRPDLIAALDAAIPDVIVPIKDTHNPDLTKSCGVPTTTPDQVKLGAALADMLARFAGLYDDGTMPRSTESLSSLMASIQTSTEAQQAFTRLSSRLGYRPVATILGAARPALAYPSLRDLGNATMSVVSPDSRPYDPNGPFDLIGNRIPVPGPAYAQLNQVVATMQQVLRTSVADPVLPNLVITQDNLVSRAVLSRPRDNLEALSVVMMAENPAFGGGNPRYIVRRDVRGYAQPAMVNGVFVSPFVDQNNDGLADIDSLGQFVSSSGQAPPPPFFAVGAPTPAAAYDTFDRSLAGGQLLYNYVDTSHTFTASMLGDLKPLVNPNITQNHESLMYMLGGAYVMMGSRDGANTTQKVYGDSQSGQVTISYNAFHPENSPFVDLVYAVGQVLGDSSTDDTLVMTKSLMQNNQGDLARTVGAGLAFKDVANKHPEATLPAKSTFWDEMIDVMIQVEKEPGLLDDVIRSVEASQSTVLGGVLADYMQYKDHISYDRNNLNGPTFNFTTNDNSQMKTPVDRTQADTGGNRSAFQKFLQVVHDTHNVTACNKEGAVLHAQGVPILGSGDICAGTLALCGLPGTRPFHECEVFKIENLAKFYIDSVVGRASIYLRPSVLRNGILGIGAATVSMMEQSSGITGFWDPPSSNNIRPKPQFLNRQVYFDIDNDSPNPGDINYTTNHFLKDLMGAHTVGTIICPENLIPDPDPGAADASPDGYVHGLRSCQTGQWVDQRDPDATFVLEDFSAYDTLAPMINAFAIHGREDLYIELLETIYRHWADTKALSTECNNQGTAQTNPYYCSEDGLVSYEPLLSEGLPGDLLPALNQVTKDVDATVVPHCATMDPNTHLCTSVNNYSGLAVLINATRGLIDPGYAAANSLTDRHGVVTSLRNDGTKNPQTTPIYLLTQALDNIDAAFAAYTPVTPSDANRLSNWRLGRSQLVDQFLSVTGTGSSSAFKDAAIPNITPTLIDMLRSQMLANCPTSWAPPYTRCAWARDDLTNKLSDSIKGPIFSTNMDLLDAVRQQDDARSQLEGMLSYLVDAASTNDALASLLASSDDIIQVLRDDTNLVPIYHALAPALSPSTHDANGRILSANIIDGQLTLLSHIAGKYIDGNGNEICAAEADPNQILTQVLTHLVTPMTDKTGHPTQTPLEVIIDVIADVNRVDPSQTNKLAPTDYGAIASQVDDFLMNKQFGLEQFYEIVRKGTD